MVGGVEVLFLSFLVVVVVVVLPVVYLSTSYQNNYTTLHQAKNIKDKRINEHRGLDSNQRPPDPRERVLGY